MSVITCDVCSKNFPTLRGLWNHTVKMHFENLSTLPKKPFPCQECIKSFDSKQCLEKHVRKDHKTSLKLEEFKELQSQNKALVSMVEKNIESVTKIKIDEKVFFLESELQKRNEEITKLVEAVATRLPPEKNGGKSDAKHGYVYLLQEREFVDKKEEIYKVGRSTQPNHKRFQSYPKGSKLLYQFTCDDCVKAEKTILQKFGEMFVQCKDYGTEYFRGNYREMFDVMCEVVNSERIVEEVEKVEFGLEETLKKAKKYDAICSIICRG